MVLRKIPVPLSLTCFSLSQPLEAILKYFFRVIFSYSDSTCHKIVDMTLNLASYSSKMNLWTGPNITMRQGAPLRNKDQGRGKGFSLISA